MKGKVVREFYRLVKYAPNGDCEIIATYDKYTTDMYYDAFKFAGEHKTDVVIERVTVAQKAASMVDTLFGATEGETIEVEVITGSRRIGPEHFATDAVLSRYNPVNGWVIPEEIDL